MKVKLKLNILSVKNYSKTKKGIVSDANMLSLIQAKRENQEKLFSVNVRGDLFNIKTIRKNPVANSIKETIIQIMENKIEPNSFYWRNQGGIMFAKSITDIGDGYYEVEMTEEYHGIGNGQQTISLSDYFSNKYEIHKDIEMPMRILIGFSEKECREMCKTNNTSNKITTKDVISNDWSTIAKEWQELDLQNFAKELRKNSKPMVIAANKADLCKDLDILNKISDKVIPCSAETELLLRKAAKAGIISYSPGDESFSISTEKEIPPPQQKALELVKNIFSKINSTGVQNILNHAVFDSLNFIVVYPVEDENKLTNKDGVVLPDAKLLPRDSTAKELAAMIHADIAKGFLHAIDCKTKQRISGEQKLKNGDVIKIVSTLSRG